MILMTFRLNQPRRRNADQIRMGLEGALQRNM